MRRRGEVPRVQIRASLARIMAILGVAGASLSVAAPAPLTATAAPAPAAPENPAAVSPSAPPADPPNETSVIRAEPWTDVIIELRIGRVAERTIVAMLDGDRVLVPARPLFELIEMRTEVDAEGCLHVVRQPENTELFVDGQLAIARAGTVVLPRPQVVVHNAGGELYLGSELIAGLLGVRVEVDLGELTVTLDPADSLPVGRRVARERAREARFGAGASVIPDRVLGPNPDPVGGAALDWTLTVPDMETPELSAYGLRLGTRVLGGGLDVRHEGVRGAQGRSTGSWIGQWPEHWGWRQLRLGTVLGTGLDPRSIHGIAASSSPFVRPLAFGRNEVTGWLAPGWEIELHRNGQLVDFTYADERGFYKLETPIDYGENPIEVRAFGPNGELRELSRALPVARDRLPGGVCEYEASVGACDGANCDQAANLDLRYGLSDGWTVRGGTTTFGRHGPDLLHPYGAVSGSVGDHWLVRGEAVAGARGGLDVAFEPSPDFRVGATHLRFDSDVEAPILTAPGQRSQTRAALHFRPDPRRASTFLSAGVDQAMQEHGSNWRTNLGFTTQLAGVRCGAEWREERSQLPGLDLEASILAANASTALRSRVPVIGGLFVRGTTEVECRRAALTRANLLIGRSLNRWARFELTTGWSEADGGFGFSLALSALEDAVHSIGRVTHYGDGRTVSSAFAEGSLLWNEAVERVEFAPGRAIGRGGVSGSVFIDENANGWPDAGEPRLPQVGVFVGSQRVRTDAFGRYAAWDLTAFEAAQVAIDLESLPSPVLVPDAMLASVVIEPNGYREVHLPLARGVEVEGRVIESAPGEERPLGGVRIVLRHVHTGRTHETITFYDGAFYFMSLPAGEYAISMPADMSELLGLVIEEPAPRLVIPKASERVSRLPELTIRLQRVVD